MSMNKSKGNMYDWCSNTHAHLGGECPHKCVYCFVDNPRFGRNPKFCGEIRLLEDEFKVKYGKGKTIFIDHMNDLWSSVVPAEMISRVLAHCNQYPDNTFVFQTKNPDRYFGFFSELPPNRILGTTIETNRDIPEIGTAPSPHSRYIAMKNIRSFTNDKLFVTVEPILDFDVEEFARWIAEIRPDFLNIGADSKGHGLKEPPIEKIHQLVEELRKYGIEVRKKHNMDRLEARQHGEENQ